MKPGGMLAVGAVLALMAALLGAQEPEEPVGPLDSTLADFVEQQEWDEVIARGIERLADLDPATAEAARIRLHLGRGWLGRAEQLGAGRAFSFARDLSRSALERAIELLGEVRTGDAELDRSARRWWCYARYRRGDDATLGEELEAWFAASEEPYAARLRGRLAMEDQDPCSATDWFTRALAAGDEDAALALDLATQAAACGRRDEALAAYERSVSGGAEPFVRLATLLSMLPDARDAETRLPLVRTTIDAAGLATDAMAAWHEAWALEQLGRLEEAEAALARATDQDTGEVARVHASLLERLGREPEAVDRLAGSLPDPLVRRALRDLADRLAIGRRHELALDAYERILLAEPNDERAARNRALTLAYAGQVALAQEAWDVIVQRHPGRPELLNDAALCAAGAGQWARARDLLERAAPQFGAEDARENLAALLLESAPSRAEALATQVLAVEPDRDRSLWFRHRARRRQVRDVR